MRHLRYRKFDENNWRDRLCIEYVELSQKIQKIEIQLNRRVFVEEANRLLFEQYHCMLQYREALFKRIYDFQIELYDYSWKNNAEV